MIFQLKKKRNQKQTNKQKTLPDSWKGANRSSDFMVFQRSPCHLGVPSSTTRAYQEAEITQRVTGSCQDIQTHQPLRQRKSLAWCLR